VVCYLMGSREEVDVERLSLRARSSVAFYLRLSYVPVLTNPSVPYTVPLLSVHIHSHHVSIHSLNLIPPHHCRL